MKTSFFLLASALLFSTVASAQSLISVPDEQELMGTAPTAPTNKGSVAYFGVVHSQDAQHAQFAQLRQAFETNKPTLVLYQGPDMGVESSETATIKRLGEGGYVRYLAQQHQVATERLDDPIAEYEYLKTRIDPEPLKLYYLLRQTMQLQQRNGLSKHLTKQTMESLLANSARFLPGTEQLIHDMNELELVYRAYCPAGGKWWQASAAWFSPSAPTATTPSACFAKINEEIGLFRQRSLRQKLDQKAQAGQRVLVVTTADYLPASPAIEPLALK